MSQYGYIFTWNGTSISWCSKRQKSVSISTYEAELFGLVEAYKEALWIGLLFENFNTAVNSIRIYKDNKSMISTAVVTESHGTSKHIGFRKKLINEIIILALCVLF